LRANNEYIIFQQLLRSTTCINANANEASVTQTKKDFIAKIAISSKEARKTHYWLSLLQKSQLVPLDYNRYILHRTS
jgi:four helix bundle protein